MKFNRDIPTTNRQINMHYCCNMTHTTRWIRSVFVSKTNRFGLRGKLFYDESLVIGTNYNENSDTPILFYGTYYHDYCYDYYYWLCRHALFNNNRCSFIIILFYFLIERNRCNIGTDRFHSDRLLVDKCNKLFI